MVFFENLFKAPKRIFAHITLPFTVECVPSLMLLPALRLNVQLFSQKNRRTGRLLKHSLFLLLVFECYN